MDPRTDMMSVEEFFGCLPEPVREHSRRVSAYAELIFTELCASEEYTVNVNSRVRLRPENRELVAEAALYHDVGKALVPEVYHNYDPDWSPEEIALYRRHAAAGAKRMEELLTAASCAPARLNIIREGLEHHHRRWDGTDAEGRGEENIPVVGRIVAAADALDHALMTTRTETPVDSAVEKLMMESGSSLDPVIMGLLYEARMGIARIFSRYSGASMAIPQAPRIIRRKVRRPLWLEYSPLVNGGMAGQLAAMRFRRGKETLSAEEAAAVVKDAKLMQSAGMAFILEACDTLRRMDACEVGGEFIVLPCVPGFLKKRGAATAIIKQLRETDSPVAGLWLMPSAADWESKGVSFTENCLKLREAGVGIVYCGSVPDAVSATALRAQGVSGYWLPDEALDAVESFAPALAAMKSAGMELFAGGVEKHRHIAALAALGFTGWTGGLIGDCKSEDELITSELALREMGAN